MSQSLRYFCLYCEYKDDAVKNEWIILQYPMDNVALSPYIDGKIAPKRDKVFAR